MHHRFAVWWHVAQVAQASNLTGVGSALLTIVREEGATALMRGAGARVAQYAPSAIVFFIVYEAIKGRATGR